MPAWMIYVAIGLVGGVSAGLFGIGGGIILIPALIYWAGFSQHMATGTSIAVLLPPIGLAAAYQYYQHGNVNVTAAIVLAVTMFVGAWLGAVCANFMKEIYLQFVFALFVFGLGASLLYTAVKRLPWGG